MDVRKMRNELLGKRLVAALESRNMEAYYVETKEEAVKKALADSKGKLNQYGRCHIGEGVWSV